MDIFRNQIQRLQEQLAGLSASQKMLAGTLVVIMVMTLYWWALYAGKAEMAVLLEQGANTQDNTLILAQLRSTGIRYQVAGGRILVPAEQREDAFAALAFSHLLPQDNQSTFNEMISKASAFTPTGTREAMMNEARESSLGTIIRRFPGVTGAAVKIDPTRVRGPNGTEPSASVVISTRARTGGDAKLVNAAADLVAGAVANLKRSSIRIIIDGASHTVRDRDSAFGSGEDYLTYVQKAERHFHDKVLDHLRFIEGVMVSVSVQPNIERKETIDHKVDPKNVVQAVLSEETETDETEAAQRGGGEAGVVANGRMALPDAPTPEVNRTSSERTRSTFLPAHGKRDEKVWNPGGDVKVLGCSVLVPRSRFVEVYKHQTNTTDNPDPTVIEPFIAAQLATVKSAVCFGLGLKEADVHVATYADLLALPGGAAPLAASAAGSLALGGHVKEIALGALALLSLLMVAGMVKKGTPAPAVAVPQPMMPKLPVQLAGGEEVIGEAAEGLPTLDAMEVDEDSMKASQMVTQVSQMVGENPDAAANLVKRWLIRS